MNGILGFDLKDLTSWKRFLALLYRPTDGASLGVVRALFGLLMVVDIAEERGLSRVDVKWGNPDECRFPLFSFFQPFPMQWMCIVYGLMWLGAVGIMLGFLFRLSCISFLIPYVYIFLLDKTTWNNHSYLYGLTTMLLLSSQANQYCSIDSFVWPKKTKYIPLWNYAILRYQFFILYFVAGLKKIDPDWLNGHSMGQLSYHWVFTPFRHFLTGEEIDYWIIHVGGFLLDLTIGFWLFFDKTRPIALLFCASFHVMNSQLFAIGMFPYVCLVTMLLFCNPDWPRNLIYQFRKRIGFQYSTTSQKKHGLTDDDKKYYDYQQKWKKIITVSLLGLHIALQAFLPYSHFITKGYNTWTNGLYGYSWDMMVHNWNTIRIMPRIVDETTGQEHFLDANAWVSSDRWAQHADMVVQWAKCMETNLRESQEMHHVSVYLDVWSSLNGRFQQRMYDPHVNLLTADWSPFKQTPWIMPLMLEFSTWRSTMNEIEEQVFSWSNQSDVLFVADFPGLTLENYIGPEMKNVSLTVLYGQVIFEQLSPQSHTSKAREILLNNDESTAVLEQAFHYVRTVSSSPSCYMYTFTSEATINDGSPTTTNGNQEPNLFLRAQHRYNNFKQAFGLLWNAVQNISSTMI
ncbi:hypothetical protein B566_EDAN006031 [Ephemera danica]|nr:hypothetical protein B566_EDAN006031 [Ephemera danica]